MFSSAIIFVVAVFSGEILMNCQGQMNVTTEESVSTELASTEEGFSLDDVVPGSYGVGRPCIFYFYAKYPTAVSQIYCICLFVCLDRPAPSVTPEQAQQLKEYFDSVKKNYKEKNRAELIAFFTGYTTLAVLGICGNALVLITLVVVLKQNSSTNIFIGSLSVADLFVCGINIPGLLHIIWADEWLAGEVTCVAFYYLYYAFFIVSVLTLTTMSLERWLAICHPMKAQVLSTASRARRTVLFTWLLGFALAIPTVFVTDLLGDYCRVFFGPSLEMKAFSLYTLIVIFIVPLSLMTVAYGQTSVALYKSIKMSQSMQSKSDAKGKGQSDTQGRIKVIKMLVAVLVVFLVCWSPTLVRNTLVSFGWTVSGSTGRQNNLIDRVFRLLSYTNSAANPILYAFLSTQFRNGFIRCFTACCKAKRGVRGKFGSTASTSGQTGSSVVGSVSQSVSA